MTSLAVAICVNPQSGRDVRRLAARATNMTHEAKRDLVAHTAAGLDAVGVTDIYVAKEPFRIAAAALEYMDLKARVHVVEFPLKHAAIDTETAVREFMRAGCRTMVSFGGDGTHRAIVRALGRRCVEMSLIPLSTGTNNVFPSVAEPTIAGMVAGLNAAGLLAEKSLKRRCKVLHVHSPAGPDIGLIDAVLLERDHVGNLLPFDAARIRQIFLSRAEPGSIGMSPIGGLCEVVGEHEDEGLLVKMGPGRRFQAPLSPGLFRELSVASTTRVGFAVAVPFRGPGVLALDGDRDIRLRDGEHATVTLVRDGPWVIDVQAAMRWAVAHGIMPAATQHPPTGH
ncbi:MAG: NAD(+)/NADH kinase [Proteobacteria bacterium]|nr:NAD(+)/NADH kinase [Pseudomonadota bacterium]